MRSLVYCLSLNMKDCESMESAWNYYYNITKRVLLFIGQWPYQERRTKLFRMSLFTVITISLMIPQVGKLIQCGGDTRCLSLTVSSCMVSVFIVLKLCTCQFNSSKIKRLTDHLRDDWEKLENAEEYKIMKTYAMNAKSLTLACCLFYHIVVGTFVSISLIPHILNVVLPLNESRPIFMPYEAYYFVDSEKYFFYIFFHALVGTQIIVTATVAHDCILLVYIEHVCSIFAVAGFRFGNLSRNDHGDAVNNSLDDVYDRKIAVSVHAHWRAIQFAELLEKTFCLSFAIQIMLITIILSISLLQVVLQLNEFAEAMRYMAFVICQILHLFYYSFQGQKLIDHSVQIRDKIYNSSWYDLPAKSQSLLLYIMRRSLQPKVLSAGKIYIFSLKSFITVVQTAVSYFTVLASFQ